jgi:hypothetical protein
MKDCNDLQGTGPAQTTIDFQATRDGLLAEFHRARKTLREMLDFLSSKGKERDGRKSDSDGTAEIGFR